MAVEDFKGGIEVGFPVDDLVGLACIQCGHRADPKARCAIITIPDKSRTSSAGFVAVERMICCAPCVKRNAAGMPGTRWLSVWEQLKGVQES